MEQSAETVERLKLRLKLRLAEWLEEGSRNGQPARPEREAIRAQLRQILASSLRDVPALSPQDHEQLINEVTEEIVSLGPLDELLTDPTVSEIMVNGPTQLYVEREGRLERTAVRFRDTAHLMSCIERLLDPVGAAVNEAEPCLDASLSDGSRVHVIIPPLALNGPTLTIRKKLHAFVLADWVRLGSISSRAAQFLEACVKARANIVISGGTSTGKTTLVSILATAIAPIERIITIENVAELDLPGREHWVRLVSRPPNLQGRGEITLRTLVKNALHMRPDRLILGEARGGEALDVIQAMLTGHDGVVTVLHASSPQAALERFGTLMLMSGLELPVEVCRQQVASAVELLVHLAHFPDGSRRVERIVQMAGVGSEGFVLEELFVFQLRHTTAEGKIEGELVPTGRSPRFHQKFIRHNIHLPEDLFAHA